MEQELQAYLQQEYGVPAWLCALCDQVEDALSETFARFERTALHNQAKVLAAFRAHRVAAMHMQPSSGYGYDDVGRDTLDKVFASALDAEDALVRPQFANGTHAIAAMLKGALAPGDLLLCASGAPYDTLADVVGNAATPAPRGSLCAMGVAYRQVDLTPDGHVDFDALAHTLAQCRPAVVHLQRSRGYAWRDALSLSDIARVANMVHAQHPEAIVSLDNCYGEFAATKEPPACGVDVMAGSLIKNPGGGLAPTGGYVAGRAQLVSWAAEQLTVAGAGREVGSYAAMYTPFYQGLFFAPHVVAQSLKTAALAAGLMQALGFETMPAPDAARDDIIQSVRFGDAQKLIAFCQGVQMGAPIDSFVTPEPWDMPGYSDPVIMAAGAFVQGSSIEWSADGPIRPPYSVYIQGGLTYEHGKLALLVALAHMAKEGYLEQMR